MNEMFQANGVSKRFSSQQALNKVSITVPRGSIYGLLGPNGAGKTTLIRIINQIMGPDEGELYFNGERLRPYHINNIGYLPEERGLYKKMKVGEQALYLAQLKGLKKAEALKRLKYWFEKFEIQAWWNKKVEELSKGMQQKMQFVVTILHKPELLIFDEPFSGFDPINVNLIKEEILQLKAEGSTIIFSTHNMSSVEELCDHITLINKAKMILQGKVKDIKDTFKSNIYEVEYFHPDQNPDLFLPEGMEIVENRSDNNVFYTQIHMKPGLGPNDLLMSLIPHAEVHSLREIIPTMNDIFITTVKESQVESAE